MDNQTRVKHQSLNAKILGLTAAASALLAGNRAQASLEFAGSGIAVDNTYAVSATATFTAEAGNQLQVVLENTGSFPTESIGGIVFGVLFSGAGSLTLQSATVMTGETMWNAGSKTPVTATTSILDPHGDPGWSQQTINGEFGASALGNGFQADGIISKGYNGNTDDGLGNGNHNPTYQDYVTLVFNGYTGGNAGLGSIQNVNFMFGTADQTINGIAVPEPGTLVAGTALVLPFAAGLLRTLRREKQRA